MRLKILKKSSTKNMTTKTKPMTPTVTFFLRTLLELEPPDNEVEPCHQEPANKLILLLSTTSNSKIEQRLFGLEIFATIVAPSLSVSVCRFWMHLRIRGKFQTFCVWSVLVNP